DEALDLIKHGTTLLVASRSTLLGVVAGALGFALDHEERRDQVQGRQCDLISATCALDKTPPAIAPAAWTFTTGTLEKARDLRAVALHGASEIVSEESAHAV